MYVVRNRNNSLFLCKFKPRKDEKAGFWYGLMNVPCIYLDALDVNFQDVKWEDEEPTPVKIEIEQYGSIY